MAFHIKKKNVYRILLHWEIFLSLILRLLSKLIPNRIKNSLTCGHPEFNYKENKFPEAMKEFPSSRQWNKNVKLRIVHWGLKFSSPRRQNGFASERERE